jgi:hypothetical protein
MFRNRTASRALQLLRWRSSVPGSAPEAALASVRPSALSADAGAASTSGSCLAGWLSSGARGYAAGAYKEVVQHPSHFVSINNLRDVPGATKLRKRVGRGDGGDRGKTSGRGHKGQRARSRRPGLLFDGGTRHLRKFPKVHLQPK